MGINKWGVLLFLCLPLWAQKPLSLREAVRLALDKHPAMEAVAARVQAAGTQIEQARSGYFPKLNVIESFQRSDNPVFVFSSLLTQRQYTAENFKIDRLNRPGFVNNFQSLVTADQVIYDAGQTKLQMRSAKLGNSIAGEQERAISMALIAGVVRTYHGAMLAEESLKAAGEHSSFGARSTASDVA